ncbi:MAG: NosD domain-containing protein, partial [Candidatus Thermoplasmatota archaeon]
YNATSGYLGDVVADWTSNNSAVCEVRGWYGFAHGSSVQLLLKNAGVCSVTATATIRGTPTNTTGPLTVNARTLVTVDDSGGADFTRIQDAVDFAQDGYRILVYAGTYRESVLVGKELEIAGEARASVVLDGGRGATALTIRADRVVIHNLTIENAHYGIFQDRTNNTRLYDTTIRRYSVGLFNEHTLNAWVAGNLIMGGNIGVLTNESYDDAIRWNDISLNSVYGAKSYNSRLRNCFNWNHFHDNKVGYYHDPTTEYPPMEFDGNTLEDNDVGVRVENTSSIALTNNTFLRGAVGLELLNSSAPADRNTFSGLGVGIRCIASDSNLTNNVVFAEASGITCTGGAPRIEGNDITVASGVAIALVNVDGAVVRGNDLHGGAIRVVNSRLAVLEVVNATAVLEDSTADQLAVDAVSRLESRWTVRLKAVDPDGVGLSGAHVRAVDISGDVAFEGATGGDGYTASFLLIAEVRTAAGVESRNPFTFEVAHGGVVASRTVTVFGPMEVVVTVPPAPTPWSLLAGLALAIVAS